MNANLLLRLGAVLVGAALLSSCQLGPKSAKQYGHRGTGMDQITLAAANQRHRSGKKGGRFIVLKNQRLNRAETAPSQRVS